jgi:hypothetical protein
MATEESLHIIECLKNIQSTLNKKLDLNEVFKGCEIQELNNV